MNLSFALRLRRTRLVFAPWCSCVFALSAPYPPCPWVDPPGEAHRRHVRRCRARHSASANSGHSGERGPQSGMGTQRGL